AMGKTAIAASINAVKTSAAWVLSSTTSATSWTVTQLPRIVAGFVATSASAVLNAIKTSAAWVLSATKSGTAWAITQLPRIIAAFVAIAASAGINAAKTTAVWALSAASTTKTFIALKTLLATPMVMPAIVIAAALASLHQVWKAIEAI